MNQEQYIQVLIDLHRDLERLGPGDDAFSDALLNRLTGLPAKPRIADLGCGSGAGALMLAERFRSKVRAVDLSQDFIGALARRAAERGLGELIEPIVGDIGSLDWPPHTIDLLWSEGAAYNLTFTGALNAWRPLLREGGIAVISELSYFNDNPPEPLQHFWQNAYPTIGTEAQNCARAEKADFEVIETLRLPRQAWDNYYQPLQKNMAAMADPDNPVVSAVIAEINEEISLFKRYSDHYGYSVYLLRAV